MAHRQFTHAEHDDAKPNALEDSLNGTQISTHLLYPQNLPISLLSPITSEEYQQLPEHAHSVREPKVQPLSEVAPQHSDIENVDYRDQGSASSVEIDGVHYNSRGYEICGQLNQHSKPCQRIGSCPFHKKNFGSAPKAESPKRAPKTKPPMKRGPYKRGWTKEEHMLFLNGLQIHGKGAWKEISMIVQTRTPTQIQSHAQKYFLRQKQEVKNKRSIHDISLEDMGDMNHASDPARAAMNLQNSKNIAMTMRQSNFVYPTMITGFQQDPLFINPLGQPMLSNSAMSPVYSMPYAAGTWLPQIYPFSMPLALSSPTINEEGQGIDLAEERDDTLSEQVLLKNSEEYAQAQVGDKRPYDAFSFHNYPNQLSEERPAKLMKVAESEEFLFNN